MPSEPATRRAFGIVRVSERKGREGESFVSPTEQRDRIGTACEREGLTLVKVAEEIDVSGGTPLVKRKGLLEAVEAVEAGQIDVIVGAYFDRLVRSVRVQDEFVTRVEDAGGEVFAVDVGTVSNGSPIKRLSGIMLGGINEYMRLATAERSAEAQADAVARGIPTFPGITPGYWREHAGVNQRGRPIYRGKLRRHPEDAPHVLRAFEMRDAGETVAKIREYLRAHGIERSYHGINQLLASRVVLGELHFGELVNLEAHEPIVDRELWDRVQRVRVPSGRKSKSDRLLARLGVLRCESCDARMVVGSSNNNKTPTYRCPATGDCTRKATIGAERVEQVVVDHVRAAIANAQGRASIEDNARGAEDALGRAQADLDSAIRAFAGVADEQAARERLAELRASRDSAQKRVDHLGGHRASVVVNGSADWEDLSLDGRRALIQATVDRALVRPGRGADRVTVELVSE
jgi:DNA invertase Pin-like site-specific DNA recombinase